MLSISSRFLQRTNAASLANNGIQSPKVFLTSKNVPNAAFITSWAHVPQGTLSHYLVIANKHASLKIQKY